jgi:hypothetical protein
VRKKKKISFFQKKNIFVERDQKKKTMWLSLDPRTMAVVPYPDTQAEMLEAAFLTRRHGIDAEVYLGLDFFCATVHFPADEPTAFYQTTPGNQHDLGRFRMPGYRSVRRCERFPAVFGARRICGEWRFCETRDAEELLTVTDQKT